MSASIVASYNDAVSVSFTSEAWFNATTVAAHFGRRPVDWLALDSTKDYIAHLGAVLNCEESSLLRTKAGRHGGGTWLHPKLAVAFARWLDVRFAIWCDMQIDKILHDRPTIALKDLRSKKALPGVLTLEQQDAIKALVKSRVDALPEDRRAKAAITCWSALKSKFGCSYKLIPPAQFGEALSLIARLDLGDASQDLLGAMRLANSPGALAGRRFLIRFSPGGDHYTASPVPEQAAVLTMRGFLRAIADPNGLLFPMDDTDLMFDAVESLQRMLRLRHAYFNRIGRA